MTIALGIIASDGIVIAADREENDGYLKNDTGKILHTFRGLAPIGWMATAGAGDGPPIDEVSRILADSFCSEGEKLSSDVKAMLVKEHRAYYERMILPFALQTDRPDYSLILGCLGGGLGKGLFVTSRLAFNEVSDYIAIGAGETVAHSWLGRLYDRMPALSAATLAAYVIYQVKKSVNGCGLGTDIIMMTGKELFGRVNPDLIRKWEDIFRFYPSLERGVFGYCIGVESNQAVLMRTHTDKDSISANMDKLRAALTQSDVQKLEPGS